jgi:hypothetical protein
MDIYQVLDCERARIEAMIRGDAQALRRLFHPGLLWVHSSGVRDDRDSFIGKIESGDLIYHAIDFPERTPRAIGDGVLLVGSAVVTATTRGVRKTASNRFSNVWSTSDGSEWQMLYWQSTAMPAS